jgi:hypothetical protein
MGPLDPDSDLVDPDSDLVYLYFGSDWLMNKYSDPVGSKTGELCRSGFGSGRSGFGSVSVTLFLRVK